MVWKNDQVSEKETTHILDEARKKLDVLGDFVEMGCYKGDTSLALAEVVENYNKNIVFISDEPVENLQKKLWIYDSFEGLPKKQKADESVLGQEFVPGELTATKQEVKKRFLRAGLKVPVITKGWFSDLSMRDFPEKVAFAFLDGDFYESIKDSLRLVTPLISPGGVVIVHDYNNMALPGVKKAVDEWMREKNLRSEVFGTLIKIEGWD